MPAADLSNSARVEKGLGQFRRGFSFKVQLSEAGGFGRCANGSLGQAYYHYIRTTRDYYLRRTQCCSRQARHHRSHDATSRTGAPTTMILQRTRSYYFGIYARSSVLKPVCEEFSKSRFPLKYGTQKGPYFRELPMSRATSPREEGGGEYCCGRQLQNCDLCSARGPTCLVATAMKASVRFCCYHVNDLHSGWLCFSPETLHDAFLTFVCRRVYVGRQGVAFRQAPGHFTPVKQGSLKS